MALDWSQNLVSAQYLENKWTEFHQILTRSIFARSRFGLLAVIFCLFVTVTALDLCQNFVSTQYLENKWIDFHQILYMHLY